MFQNLNDISDLTFTIVASFEDIMEMSEDKQPPLVGSCLEEFAEVSIGSHNTYMAEYGNRG